MTTTTLTPEQGNAALERILDELEYILDELDDALWDAQFAAHPEVIAYLSARADEQIRLGQVYEVDGLEELDIKDAEAE